MSAVEEFGAALAVANRAVYGAAMGYRVGEELDIPLLREQVSAATPAFSDETELWRLLDVPGIAVTPEVVAAYLAAYLGMDSSQMYLAGAWVCQWLKSGTDLRAKT